MTRWVVLAAILLVALASLWPILDALGTLFNVDLLPWQPADIVDPDPADALLRPAFLAGGDSRFLFGSDNKGRDVQGLIEDAAQVSFAVAVAGIALAMAIGVPTGLAAGYRRGWLDRAMMRCAEAQRPFPPLVVALLADGVARTMVAPADLPDVMLPVLAVCIGIGRWPHFATVVRDAVRAERYRPYVDAARLLGISPFQVALQHVLPNVFAPALVLALASLGFALADESALSFLGIGMPPESPSLGTLLQLGHAQLANGAWWTVLFPAVALVLPLMAIALAGAGIVSRGWRRR